MVAANPACPHRGGAPIPRRHHLGVPGNGGAGLDRLTAPDPAAQGGDLASAPPRQASFSRPDLASRLIARRPGGLDVDPVESDLQIPGRKTGKGQGREGFDAAAQLGLRSVERRGHFVALRVRGIG